MEPWLAHRYWYAKFITLIIMQNVPIANSEFLGRQNVRLCNNTKINVIPTQLRYAWYVHCHDHWMIWMEGAGRSGNGLWMVTWLVSRVCLYVDCMDRRGWVVNAHIYWAGLVWEGLGCVGFVYYFNGDSGGCWVHGFLCKQNRAGSNLAVHIDFFPCRIFFSFGSSHLC